MIHRNGFSFTALGGLLLLASQISAHSTSVHERLALTAMDLADQAWGVDWLVDTPNAPAKTRIFEGSWQEDGLTAEGDFCRTKHHGYNPVTDTTGGIFGLAYIDPFCPGDPWTTKAYVTTLWQAVLDYKDNLYGGDNLGAYHFLGRCCHLLQDMSTLVHIHPQNIQILEHSDFENAESSFFASAVSSAEQAALPTDPLEAHATMMLDPFSQGRLECLHNQVGANEPEDFIYTMALITYFRGTFWGEVIFKSDTWGDSSGSATNETTATTTFSGNQTIGPQPNILRRMFGADNVRYVNTWADDYFEIISSDPGHGSFWWMSSFDDEWAPCEGGTVEGHFSTSDNLADEGARTTGRFFFKEAYGNGSGHPLLPLYYPDGTFFDIPSLGSYISLFSMHVGVGYNVGLMGRGSVKLDSGLSRTLVLQSQNPGSITGVIVYDHDNQQQSLLTTPATKIINYGGKVDLIAPATAAGSNFRKWLKNGSDFSTTTQTTIWAGADDIYTAVYYGKYDLAAFAAFSSQWLQLCATPSWCESADWDQNGQVNLADLLLFAEMWLKPYS